MGYCVQNFGGKMNFRPFWNKAVTYKNVEKVQCCKCFPCALEIYRSVDESAFSVSISICLLQMFAFELCIELSIVYNTYIYI